MSEYEFDLIVIGAGSGGVRAARMSAGMGANVAIIEDRYWGGTCVNVGCVPKKLYYYASHFPESFSDAGGFGWQLDGYRFDWDALKANRRKEIERLSGIYINLLKNAGVTIFEGHGTVVDPHTVAVNGKQYRAKKILLAVGGWPFIPDIPGKDLAISSNEVFDMSPLPERMVVVGGGYIAVEFACIFSGLGVDIHLIYRGPQLLKQLDSDVADFVTNELKQHGITVYLDTNIGSIASGEFGKQVELSNDRVIDGVGEVLYATGRKPKLDGLGTDSLGLAIDGSGKIAVDEWFKTNIDSIYAVGDITKGEELTPVALAEGMSFARHFYGKQTKPLDYTNIPTAIFTQPNIATVGLTEREARQQYANIDIYRSDFRHLKHTLTDNKTRTLMKLVVDKDTDKVLGAHMVGDDAGEIIQGLAVAIKAGATKAVFDETIGIHPTAAEEFVTMREPL